MGEDLRQQLEWMLTNLEAIVKNQALIYVELKKVEEEIGKVITHNEGVADGIIKSGL
jgi:hypothetical protein